MLFRNTLAQSSRLIVGQITSVILAPILLGRLGLEAFGIWAVTGAAANYMALLDLGVTRSLSRFVAYYDAGEDQLAIRRVMTVGLSVVTVVGSLAVLVALFAAPLVDGAIGNPIGEGEMRTVLLSSAVLFALQLMAGALSALPTGMRRMVPPNVAGTVGILCNFGASVGVLYADPTLKSYAIANAVSAVPALAASWVSVRWVWRGRLLARPSRTLVREVVSFSVKTQLSNLADLINFQTDKVVVAVSVGIRAAAAYEIGARVAIAVREVAVLSMSAMIPTATAEIVKHGREVIGQVYEAWSGRVIAISVGVFALAALCSPYLLTAWLGQSPPDSQGVLIGLSVAFLAWTSTGVASTTAIGAGDPGLPARNAMAMALLNVVLTVILAPLFGIWGVMAGTVGAMTIMAARFLVLFHRKFAIPGAAFRDAAVGPAALGAMLVVPIALVVAVVLPTPTDRWPALGLLVAVGSAYGLPYWILATARDYVPEQLRFPGVRVRRRAQALAPRS